MYQSSLPERDVDSCGVIQTFIGQMKSHRELCTAKDQNDNLGRRRGSFHDGAYNNVTFWLHCLMCYPKTSGLLLHEAMQRLAGH